MGLPARLLNSRLVAIERAVRTGVGGDVASRTTVFSVAEAGDFNAVWEPRFELVRDQDGREIALDGVLYVDHLDADGDPLDVVVGDTVTFLDFDGVRRERVEVRVRELAGFPGSAITHLELGLRGL